MDSGVGVVIRDIVTLLFEGWRTSTASLYGQGMSLLILDKITYMLIHLTNAGSMSPPLDWLSRLLEMVPVHGHLDLHCFYGAPWLIAQDRAGPVVIPYHIVVSGSAVLEDLSGGPPPPLTA